MYVALFYRRESLLHYVGIMSTPKTGQTYCFCPDTCLSVHLSQICVCSMTLQLVEGFSNSLMQLFTTLKQPWWHPGLNNLSTPGDICFCIRNNHLVKYLIFKSTGFGMVKFCYFSQFFCFVLLCGMPVLY